MSSIDQALILKSLRKNLEKPENTNNLNGFSIDQIIEMVNIVFQTTYVKFKDVAYAQVGGLPAGSPLSNYLADCVLNDIDEEINEKFKTIMKWFRFLDDTLAVQEKDETQAILIKLNSIHPSLKFTLEKEQIKNGGTSITFLDLEIIRKTNGCTIKHFIKDSQTARTVNYNSAHPQVC